MTLSPDTGSDIGGAEPGENRRPRRSPHQLAEELDRRRADRQPARRGRPGPAECGCHAALDRTARELCASSRPWSTASTSGRDARADPPDGRRRERGTRPHPLLPLRVREGGAGGDQDRRADGLAAAGVEFDAVPDLCEMAARGDARLRELAAGAPLTIAACYPRAVKWLFASAGAALPTDRSGLQHAHRCSPTSSSNGLLEDTPDAVKPDGRRGPAMSTVPARRSQVTLHIGGELTAGRPRHPGAHSSSNAA